MPLVEVSQIRCHSVKRLVRPTCVVEVEVPGETFPRLGDRGVGPEIDLLVLDRPPQSFDKDIVPPCRLAVHRDLDAMAPEHAGGLEPTAPPLDREVLAGQHVVEAPWRCHWPAAA